MPQAGRLDASDEQLERLLVGAEVGREAPLVADRRAQAAVVQRLLERVEDLRAHAQGLAEGRRSDGHDHELLEVDLVVGVGAAVEDVHLRDGQHVRRVATQVAPQRQPLLPRGRVRRGQRHADDRVRAEARLVRRAVEVDHRPVQAGLVGGVATGDRVGELAIDVGDRLHHSLAPPALTAVAQLGGLELARRCPAGHGRAAVAPGTQNDLDLDGRVAPRVQDLAAVHLLDLAH
jgi:hypothetical protein